MKQVLTATNNRGKVDRYRRLLAGISGAPELLTPAEAGIEPVETEETGETLEDNAYLKASAYLNVSQLPILANDTGFWVQGEGMINAPKRRALGDRSAEDMSAEQLSRCLLDFWKGVAAYHGGKVPAAWVESFVVLHPDGTYRVAHSRREVVLTDREFGTAPLQVPVRALYYSQATGKPAILHTEEEELQEMEPVIQALKEVLL